MKRLDNIDILKSIGIILVVVGHSSLPDMVVPAYFNFLQKWIYSFHMPLFFAASGYLLGISSGKGSYSSFVLSKAKRLLLPYFVLTFLAIWPKSFLNAYTLRHSHMDINGFVTAFLYPWENPVIAFWFLPTLFIIFLLQPIWKRLPGKPIYIQFLLFALLTFIHLYNPLQQVKFLNLSGAGSNIMYFAFGYLCLEMDKRNVIRSKFIEFILMFTIVLVSNYLDCSSRVVHVLTALCGIRMVFALSSIEQFKPGKWFIEIGQYSYQIYLLSWFSQSACALFLLRILHLPPIYEILTSIFLGLYFPIWISKVVQKFCPQVGPLIGFSKKEMVVNK